MDGRLESASSASRVAFTGPMPSTDLNMLNTALTGASLNSVGLLAQQAAALATEAPAAQAPAASPTPAPAAQQRSTTLADMARQGPQAGASAGAAVGAAAAQTKSELALDDKGMVHNERVLQVAPSGKASRMTGIERGALNDVKGIVVHQTESPTAQSTFNSYSKPGANGAHFLIDKDGSIYQTASLEQKTQHVGRLKSRCQAEGDCSPADAKANKRWDPGAMNQREQAKPAGERFPSNSDSIGIELVGEALPVKGQKEKVYETVTDAQNAALSWLVKELKSEYAVPDSEVFRHPDISWKNMTEASTAKW